MWFALINNKCSPLWLLSRRSCEIRCCGVHVATSGSPVAVSRRLWGGSDRREDDASLSSGHSFRRSQGMAARTRWLGSGLARCVFLQTHSTAKSPRMWVLLRALGRPRSRTQDRVGPRSLREAERVYQAPPRRGCGDLDVDGGSRTGSTHLTGHLPLKETAGPRTALSRSESFH